VGVPRCDRLSLRVVSSMLIAEVEGRGPRGRGIGDCRVVITSPREVIRLSIKCGMGLGGGATRVGAEEMDEEREMITGRIGWLRLRISSTSPSSVITFKERM